MIFGDTFLGLDTKISPSRDTLATMISVRVLVSFMAHPDRYRLDRLSTGQTSIEQAARRRIEEDVEEIPAADNQLTTLRHTMRVRRYASRGGERMSGRNGWNGLPRNRM